jgi:hypothetical protein
MDILCLERDGYKIKKVLPRLHVWRYLIKPILLQPPRCDAVVQQVGEGGYGDFGAVVLHYIRHDSYQTLNPIRFRIFLMAESFT